MRRVAVKIPTASHTDGLRIGSPHAKRDALGGQTNVVGNGANTCASGGHKLHRACGGTARHSQYCCKPTYSDKCLFRLHVEQELSLKGVLNNLHVK